MASAAWARKSSLLFQFLMEGSKAFPGQLRHTVSPVCHGSFFGSPLSQTYPKHVPKETSRKHPYQMIEPPQLTLFHVEELRLYFEFFSPDNWTSHPFWKSPATLWRKLNLTASISDLILLITKRDQWTSDFWPFRWKEEHRPTESLPTVQLPHHHRTDLFINAFLLAHPFAVWGHTGWGHDTLGSSWRWGPQCSDTGLAKHFFLNVKNTRILRIDHLILKSIGI